MSWTYDAQGRVLSKGQTVGTVTKTVGYTYTNGDLTTLTTPSGQSVVFAYTNHRISGITINGTTLLSSVQYEPFGSARGWTWGNATSEIRLHDTDGNPSQTAGLESVTYGYDNAFRITSATNGSNAALSWTYGYDALDRLTSASKTGTTQGWTYDANGNRLTQTGTVSGTYTISPTSNRLTSITGTPARTYTYNNAGSALTFGTVTNTYYNSGRLKTAKVGSSTTTYVYNALGQRVKKSGGSAGTVLYAYDESGHLLGEYSSTGALVQETIWLEDTPVATIRSGSPAVVYYVHADQLNAPRMVTRPSDNKIAWRWDTDPFGTTAPNENPQSLGTFKYNARFPGQLFDSETSINYNYFRDYDSQVGRYVESDPVGLDAGVNTYVYVDGSPTGAIDPVGLGPIKLIKLCAKGFKAIRNLSKSEAVKLAREGGVDIKASSHKEAREIARLASEGKKPIRDAAHPDPAGSSDGRMPHYHTNPRNGSHIFYGIAAAVTAAHYSSCSDCTEEEILEAVDFFNPLSTPKDIFDLIDEF
jgi:RHS repeat-associated protein